jgi:glycogen debranching enzyme
MLDVIEVENEYYVRARSSLADKQTRVLMHGDLFAVFDRQGDFQPLGSGEHGLYFKEARHLSALALCLPNERLLLLSSNVREDNAILAIDLTNPDLETDRGQRLPHGTIHLYRTKFLNENACYEQIRVRNYGLVPAAFELVMQFGADFADIFEVRGHRRSRPGQFLSPETSGSMVILAYQGLDGVLRKTRITSTFKPAVVGPSAMHFRLELEPQQETEFSIIVACSAGSDEDFLPFGQAVKERDRRQREFDLPEICTSNEQFNDWVNRSKADLRMMISATPQGPYPYAGVPWFSTPFGRDGIVTALECLWLNPALAKGVLQYLAATQATENNPIQDAEPGKILHETRKSELARIGEVPFGRYYGSADSTPLFLCLAAAYFERTNDRELMHAIWSSIERALHWIAESGDCDGDGFVEYHRRSTSGLVQQGWKDSPDSIFHSDGRIAEGPIALCEIQAYVYAAKRGIAVVAAALGYAEKAQTLRDQAQTLRERFEQAFWCDDIGLYALALDGEKGQCRVASSNAGHCLFTGISGKRRALQITETFRSEAFFSGWGVRTIANSEKRYNPMSYHNGSVWPHDNALIAFGCAQTEQKGLACQILTGLLDSSIFLDIHRLPELFCGFSRRPGRGPTLYPVACSPQAWAAGSVFLVLQSCIGLTIRAPESRIYFYYPSLPESIQRLKILDLKVGSSSVDLELRRYEKVVSVDILRREGELEIVTIK